MMDNFFSKKGLSFSRNHQPSSQIAYQHKFNQQERFGQTQPTPTYSVPYAKTMNEPMWTPHNYGNNNSFSSRSPQPSQYSYTSYNQSSVSNPVKTNDAQYLQVPNKFNSFPHKRNVSEYSNSRSQFSQEEFKEMQAQFPSVSTQDKTPKNINNAEEGKSMTYIPSEKKDETFKYTSMGNIDHDKGRPTNIKQIKEELLNQGRKDKEGGLREDRSRKELSASRKNLEAYGYSAIGSSS